MILPSLLKEDMLMVVGSDYNVSLQCLQNFNQAGTQLESEQSEEAQKLECKYNVQ